MYDVLLSLLTQGCLVAGIREKGELLFREPGADMVTGPAQGPNRQNSAHYHFFGKFQPRSCNTVSR